MTDNRGGFTLVEMLVAVVIMAVGLLALAAGTGSVTRTLSSSRIATQAAQQAQLQLDLLRALSRANPPIPCTHASFTSSPAPQVRQLITVRWEVPPAGFNRVVRVITSSPLGGGRARVDTFTTTISCN